MKEQEPWQLVVPSQFIRATRDSGYKGIASAVAELIDNALEAKAKNVSIRIEQTTSEGRRDVVLVVSDDGRGMTQFMLRHALRFGWSSRFNSRETFGRYGMGLPNASLSLARRVEVYSCANGREVFTTYLDVDQIEGKDREWIPRASKVDRDTFAKLNSFGRGTAVVWRKCDSLMDFKLTSLRNRLTSELGRLFRYQVWSGKYISVDGETVLPSDPLFERKGINLSGASGYGPDLQYSVVVPGQTGRESIVNVRFTELPVRKWSGLSNAEKNKFGIAKTAGVSVVRAGREIDRGWYFMGQKRKENYDDWWRCEIRFQPELDELFGVTHTKQEIHPTRALLEILTPDMEKIARKLNARASNAFLRLKEDSARRSSERQAEQSDCLLEPPKQTGTPNSVNNQVRKMQQTRNLLGLEYRLRFATLSNTVFYRPDLDDKRLTVLLNAQHPFVVKVFGELMSHANAKILKDLELLLFAAARGEMMAASTSDLREWSSKFREIWSDVLTAFYG